MQMEANEVQELEEHAEHGEHDRMMRPVALTMTFLAVLVAVTTVLGHRTHTEVVLNQDKATDKWGEYQAQKTRSYNTSLSIDLMKVLTITDKETAKKLVEGYREHQEKWAEETKEDMAEARELEAEVEKAEAKAIHFDFGEALLEIGLVITSITLLTHKRIYWFVGLGFSVIGIVAAVMGVLMK
jgi:hypothetical protein